MHYVVEKISYSFCALKSGNLNEKRLLPIDKRTPKSRHKTDKKWEIFLCSLCPFIWLKNVDI